MNDLEMCDAILDNPTADQADKEKVESVRAGIEKYGKPTEKQGKMLYAIYCKVFGAPPDTNGAPRRASSAAPSGDLALLHAKLDAILKHFDVPYAAPTPAPAPPKPAPAQHPAHAAKAATAGKPGSDHAMAAANDAEDTLPF